MRLSSASIGGLMRTLALGFLAITLTMDWVAQGADPAEPLLRGLPSGIAVESSVEVPAGQTKVIGQKLDGEIRRLTNSVVRVHGRTIQVNVITAIDEANAQAIYAAFAKIKQPPFCTRKGLVVVEYVGKNIDAALAIKTSYELGVVEKPPALRYRVTAELATVERADYMACNLLFNHFLALESGTQQAGIQQIDELTKRFTFGHRLVLRNPALEGASTEHTFQPAAVERRIGEATISYAFDGLASRQSVPFVTATMEITVDDTGFQRETDAPKEQLTKPTKFWPVDDPTVLTLAQQITAGKSTNEAKAMAILQWLSPGQNLKYSGQTGSRWGTRKVLEQKFGHCWDFSDCFVTLARAAGVPSRQVAGWFYGSSGHVWAEFYQAGKGWQQVDPTGGGKLKCGLYHIPYFTTEDGEMPIVYVSMPKIETLETK